MRCGVAALLAAAVACGVVSAPAAIAYPGALDPAFGHRGVSSRAYAGRAASANVLVPTANGTVVVGSTAATTSGEGQLVVTRVDASGAFDLAYGSLTPSQTPAAALLEPSGRLVVAANGTPGDRYPTRITLLGFDADGRLDPSFGTGGTLELAQPGVAVALFLGTDGDLHVAGATVASESSLETGLLSATVSQDGRELGAHTRALKGADADVGAATPLPNGDTLFAGTDSGSARLFLTALTPAGIPDSGFGAGGFGAGGTAVPPIENAEVDAVTTDGRGRILLAGAYIGELGRSVGVPVHGLLARFAPNGTLDPSFAAGGAPNDGAFAFGAVTELADRSLLVLADGHPAHLDTSGQPELGFGYGGRAPIGGFGVDGAPLVDGEDVMLPGYVVPAHGYDNLMAVSRTTLTGSGIPAPVARSSIRVAPEHGTVRLRVQLASRFQSLTRATDALLVPRTVGIGDGSRYAPYAAEVRAVAGRVGLTASSGGRATVAGGTFSLRSAAGRVAVLDLSSPGCGKRTVVTLSGPFVVTVGRRKVVNTSRRARVRIGWRCAGAPAIHALAGRLTIGRFRGQPKSGSWY